MWPGQEPARLSLLVLTGGFPLFPREWGAEVESKGGSRLGGMRPEHHHADIWGLFPTWLLCPASGGKILQTFPKELSP